MRTEIKLDEEKKTVSVFSGDPPYRILFFCNDERFYELMKVIPEENRLKVIASREGYELLGIHPEDGVGSHEYERHYKIQQGDIVVDAGAHVGIWTEIYSKAVGPEGKVIAIEPDFRALGMLYTNTYHYKNVHVIPYGLWDTFDYMPFGIDSIMGISSYFSWVHSLAEKEYSKDTKPGYQLTEVNTLDNILQDLNVDKVNFIKMDIEGAEVRALKGMPRTLDSVEALAIATYHKTMEYPETTTSAVADFLKDLGFNVSIEFSKGQIVYANRS